MADLYVARAGRDLFTLFVGDDGSFTVETVKEPLTSDEMDEVIIRLKRDASGPENLEHYQWIQDNLEFIFQKWKKKHEEDLDDWLRVEDRVPKNPQQVMNILTAFDEGQLRHLQGLLASHLKKKMDRD